MKYASAIAALSLIGCGLGGNAPDISSLQGRIGALEAEIEWLKRKPGLPGPTGERGPAGASAISAHLIVKATGEDLGPYLGDFNKIWSDQLRGVVYSAAESPILYSESNCVGTEVVNGGLEGADYVIGPNGTALLLIARTGQEVVVNSAMSSIGCRNSPPWMQLFWTFEDTGVKAQIHLRNTLAIEVK